MNIYQKLIEVRKAVPYIQKTLSEQKGVSSSATLAPVRAKMDEMGLLLVPTILSEEVREHRTQSGKQWYFVDLRMRYTWINADNPEEKVESDWAGHGIDGDDKGLGKALTYSEKYFILKFFNIPTDKDDPDQFINRTRTKDLQFYKEDLDKRVKNGKQLEIWKRQARGPVSQNLGEDEIQQLNEYIDENFTFVECPNNKKDVNVKDCSGSECYKGCPAHQEK